MKKEILVFSGCIFFASLASANVCETKAIRAAMKQAQIDREESVIESPAAHVVSQEIRKNRLVTVYDVSVLHCSPEDLDECGSLSYGVVVIGSESACKVVRIEMTGEE
ncbi:hypothetical protein [Bdellovibrio sp. HCB-162]|uniref:hypothetical protein n=1 Tax=Bdellovibrio sp. HCB-162 TaxID=3394234 RepID=UPI0039BC3193